LDGDRDEGPIWFFSSTDSAIVQGLGKQDHACSALNPKATAFLPMCTATFSARRIG
jgi:general stress protein 26